MEKHPAMRVLESLTPGGSEFVDDPGWCGAWIRNVRSNQLRLIKKFKRERDAALRAIADKENLIERMIYKKGESSAQKEKSPHKRD